MERLENSTYIKLSIAVFLSLMYDWNELEKAWKEIDVFFLRFLIFVAVVGFNFEGYLFQIK